jgi:hypothetical protein
VSQPNSQSSYKRKTSIFAALLDWPLVRKLESLAFLAMFIAMPLFAFRVIDYTARQLALQNAAHDLVKDIRRAREKAIENHLDVTIEARKGGNGILPSYVMRHENKGFEEVVLPKGVFILGEVTFNPDGSPLSPATFDVHNETRGLSVDVDKQGVVSMP